MANRDATLPRRRTEDLVVVDVADEVLVYDRRRNRAHCLNRSAALVWRHLDGQTSIGELVARLRQDVGGPLDEQAVWLALKDLDRANLLEGPLSVPAAQAVSRRQWLRRVGVSAGAGAVLLPAVSSIIAPHAAAQVSPSACANPSCAALTCGGVSDCACVTTTERTSVCVFPQCTGVPCSSSAGCPPGQVCFTQGCCGEGSFCVPVCTPDGAGTAKPAPSPSWR